MLKIKYLCFAIAMLSIFALSACTSWVAPTPPQGPTSDDIASDVNKLRGFQTANAAMSPRDYAIKGYDDSLQLCTSYFDDLVHASNDIGMQKADLSAAGAAAAAIMALAHSPTKAIGVTSALVGLAGIAYDNFQNYALLTPYPLQTRKLVLNAMATYAVSMPAEGATDIIDADHRIRGYATICTYSGIADLASQAIANAKTTDVSTAPEFSNADVATVLNPFKAMIGVANSPITDAQFALLEILSESGTTPSLAKQLVAELPADVAAAVYDTANSKITNAFAKAAPLLQALAQSNSAFAASIASIKTATSQTSTPLRGGGMSEPVLVVPPKTARDPQISVVSQ